MNPPGLRFFPKQEKKFLLKNNELLILKIIFYFEVFIFDRKHSHCNHASSGSWRTFYSVLLLTVVSAVTSQKINPLLYIMLCPISSATIFLKPIILRIYIIPQVYSLYTLFKHIFTLSKTKNVLTMWLQDHTSTDYLEVSHNEISYISNHTDIILKELSFILALSLPWESQWILAKCW